MRVLDKLVEISDILEIDAKAKMSILTGFKLFILAAHSLIYEAVQV